MSDHRDDHPEPGADLGRELDAWGAVPARQEFREELRARFVGAAGGGIDGAELEERLRAYEVEPARPEFREGLRARFLSGARSAARRRLGPRLVVPTLAAAAALLLLLLGPWSTAGEVHYVLDGDVVAYAERERLSSSIEVGDCVLEVGEEDLSVLILDEGVFLEFPPSTDLRVLPRAAGDGGLLELEVRTGGVRVSTAEDFGGRIRVHTPDAVIDLSGHAVGIDVFPRGTCLCILEGEAEMSGLEGGRAAHGLGQGESAFVHRGERGFELLDGVHHRDELEDFSADSRRRLY